MRITFVTRKFVNVERYSHCDVLHITPIRVARLVLDCNGVFAIKAYSHLHFGPRCNRTGDMGKPIAVLAPYWKSIWRQPGVASCWGLFCYDI